MPPSTEPAAELRPPTRPPYGPEPDTLAARRTHITRTLGARRAES